MIIRDFTVHFVFIANIPVGSDSCQHVLVPVADFVHNVQRSAWVACKQINSLRSRNFIYTWTTHSLMTVEYLHRCLGRLSTCHSIFVSSSCVCHCSWRKTWPGRRHWGAHSATHRESLGHYPFAIPNRLLLLACSQQDMTRTCGSASMPPGCSCSAWLVGQALLGQCHSEPSCRRTSDAWQITHALYYLL